jgi:predicted enzyme related to lactoylglutathione lyase
MTTAPASFITGVDFLAVPAEDFEASVHFYGTVRGLPPIKRWGEMPGAEFQPRNLTIAIMEPPRSARSSARTACRVALLDDVDAARAHLEAQGVRFVSETIDSGVCHQAIFLDPAGNSLGIHHRYAPKD